MIVDLIVIAGMVLLGIVLIVGMLAALVAGLIAGAIAMWLAFRASPRDIPPFPPGAA